VNILAPDSVAKSVDFLSSIELINNSTIEKRLTSDDNEIKV